MASSSSRGIVVAVVWRVPGLLPCCQAEDDGAESQAYLRVHFKGGLTQTCTGLDWTPK